MLKPATDAIMVKCLHILAMTGMLFQTFGKLFILVNFKVNQQEIAATLCVRKDEPGNCCKGKCYLNKQLKEHTDREESGKSPELKIKEEVQFCQDPYQFTFYTYQEQEYAEPNQLLILKGMNSSVFRPPKQGKLV